MSKMMLVAVAAVSFCFAACGTQEDDGRLTDNTIVTTATVTLYTDTANDIRVETTRDCEDVFAVVAKAQGFWIAIPNADLWGWYGYDAMTAADFQRTVETTVSGVVKMADLNNGLLLVAFQPNDGPNESALLGHSGQVCPLPTVRFNGRSISGFMPQQ